jgi:hypothetical protein
MFIVALTPQIPRWKTMPMTYAVPSRINSMEAMPVTIVKRALPAAWRPWAD